MVRSCIATIMVFALWFGSLPLLAAEQALTITPLAEKTVSELPTGPLFWRIETFRTLAQARAAERQWDLVAESRDRVWFFRLGPENQSSAGGTKVTEVGPLPVVVASQYLLRINEASGPPGSRTPIHTHPGSEAFYVLAGSQSIRSPHGVMRIEVGQPEAGHGADMPMQVSSSGTTDLHALVMFVVDAAKPFSSPAKLP